MNSYSPEQRARGAADAACSHVGLTSLELLRIVADAAYRFSMYVVQITSLALPSLVERSVETALTDGGVADRKMLFQHSGFLPTPKTNIAITQYAHANAATQSVAAPRPEETIRRASDRFNEARGLPAAPAVALPVPVDVPDEEEDDGR